MKIFTHVTCQAKTFRTLSRFYTDSRSPAVHQPFERTGMPFERLELTVQKNSSSVRTVWAMRSTKLISCSNSSSFPFEKIHQPFERPELSVQKKLSAVRTARAIRSRKSISRLNGLSYPFKKETVSYFGSRSKKTRPDDFKTIDKFAIVWFQKISIPPSRMVLPIRPPPPPRNFRSRGVMYNPPTPQEFPIFFFMVLMCHI